MESYDDQISAKNQSTSNTNVNQQGLRKPDKIHPYRLKLWSQILVEDNTAESINFFAMILSMVAILFKYKTVGWVSILVGAVAYANSRTSQEGQPLLTTFMLSIAALVLCYISNPIPIALTFGQDQTSPSEIPVGNVVAS